MTNSGDVATFTPKLGNIFRRDKRGKKVLKIKKFRDIVDESSKKTSIKKEVEITVGSKETPIEYLRNTGYKIKSEEPTKKGIEMEFYKDSDAKNALEDLESAGLGNKYKFSLIKNYIEYIEL